MRHFPRILLIFSLLAAVAAPSLAEEIDLLAPAPDGSKLGAWKAFSADPDTGLGDVWQLDDGVLVCKGTPLGYLYTQKKYTNFVLRLQWRWPQGKPPGKGGVLVRMTGEHGVWPKSLEAQINAPDAGDFWGLAGFALDGPADRIKRLEHPQLGGLTNLKKTANAEKPQGQWNDYEIAVRGETVTLKINGQIVNEATGCDVAAGPILLTSEGNEIHFRTVKLVPLP
ncbi:MAG: DUF1080 domain-containing protein [Planctomycetes bacterium]|nr:DUF1080 domain-containing protein [Planctomycetota bacterium]